mmetsp:Transcript_110533/g.191568  ORF Transcript_110533/g.191568 Transcript_110533/m.191568 type:complete len:142 (+) Transcript_110533:52-477(+)
MNRRVQGPWGYGTGRTARLEKGPQMMWKLMRKLTWNAKLQAATRRCTATGAGQRAPQAARVVPVLRRPTQAALTELAFRPPLCAGVRCWGGCPNTEAMVGNKGGRGPGNPHPYHPLTSLHLPRAEDVCAAPQLPHPPAQAP